MTGIEYVWIIFVLIFGVVGIVRKYPRELGVTTMCVAALLLLVQFGDKSLALLQSQLGDDLPWLNSPRFAAAAVILVFLVVIFISYHGVTLVFKGTPPKGPVTPLLGLIVGLLNGYFITGTLWFYLHRHGYPFGLVDAGRLSQTANRLIHYLPPQLFEPKPGYLLALLFLLLVLSVWR